MTDGVVPATVTTVTARSWLALVAGSFGTAAYMTTITATGSALPHMQGAFSAAPDQMAWVLTAFLVGTTIATACVGWLDVRLGTRRFYMATALGFALATVFCGLSTSLVEALIYRTLQGAFGAALIPLGNAIVMDAFPRSRHGQATGMWIVVANVGPAFGPILGAELVHDHGWPWVYFLTVPLSLGAALSTWAFVPAKKRMAAPNFDWFGFAFMAVGFGALLTALSRGERLDWFESTEIIAELAITVAAIYGFVIRSATARAPFVSPGLFGDRNFVMGCIFSFVYGTVVYQSVFLIPLQLQSVAGYDILGVGELLAFRGSGVVFGALVVGLLSARMDPRVLLMGSISCGVIAAYAMSTWSTDLRAFDVAWTIFLSGLSSSASYVPLTVLAFSTLNERFRAEGMGFYYVVSMLGTSVGTAVIFNVFTRSARINHDVMVELLNPYNANFGYGFVPRLLGNLQYGGLAAMDAEMVRQATMIAYNNCFYLIAIVAAAMIPMSLMMRMPKTGR